ncbi:MAG: hypothetical protein RIB71_15770 [Imperialibacter sp.]|uniref:hypothetical protein n=1 Tax=Imperialibacter sp. TaxID=2038411 RepID=UPI0032EE381E
MKTFSGLTTLGILSFILNSCDPINCAMIENKSEKNIEFLIHLNSIDSISGSENYLIDSVSKIAKTTLEPNEEIIVAYGARIAAPIRKNDLKFNKIEIIIENDTLKYNKSAFYYSLKSRIDWPFFAMRNWYFTIK